MAEILYESNYYGVSSLGDSLEHHGIKGQKWGIRRFQNPDGSLTALGKQRYYSSTGSLSAYGQKRYAKDMKRRSSLAKKATPDEQGALDERMLKTYGKKFALDLEKERYARDDAEWQRLGNEIDRRVDALAKENPRVKELIKNHDGDGYELVEKVITETGDNRLTKLNDSAVKAFNQMEQRHSDALKKIEETYNPNSKRAETTKVVDPEEEKAKAIRDGDVKTILKYAGTMSTQELNEATNRAATIDRLKKMVDTNTPVPAKAVNNMSPQEAASKVDSLSTQEINDVLNRYNAKKRLADLIAPAKKEPKERVSAIERIQNTANKLSSLGNSIVNAKNTYDRLQEAFRPKEKEPEKSKAEELYDKWLDQAVKTAMADARNKTVGTTKDKEFAAFMTAKNMADGRDEAIKRAREIDKAIGASVEARNIKARKAEAKRVAEAEQARVKAEAKAAALANRKEREAEAERKRKEQERYQAELERIRKQAGSRMWL